MVKNAKRICVAICFGSSNNLTGLLNWKEKWTNKGTGKPYVAEFFIHSTTCHI